MPSPGSDACAEDGGASGAVAPAPFRLFCVFHANLDFSAIPDADVPVVLERCYARLLDAVEREGLPIGLEMPARTLARIAREEPDLHKRLAALAERGLLELVGSGRAQVVGPLAPVDVNRANLALGSRAYRELAGAVPTTWFANEQTFSPGLAALYREVGARALVVEWNNPASQRPELRALRARPARIATGDDATLALLWNDCVLFQRLQRAAHGDVPERDYLEAVMREVARAPGGRLCAYGGDLEIFDYRPGGAAPRGAEDGVEIERVVRMLGALARDPRIRLVLPRDVADDDPGPVVELASAQDPVPCKKQPRYNPTRWLVSGPDALATNTRCHRLRRDLRAAEACGRVARGSLDAALVDAWRSDLRTRTTEEKRAGMRESAAALGATLRARLEGAVPALARGEVARLHNPWRDAWEREIVELEVRFRAGVAFGARVLAQPPACLGEGDAQVDVLDRHRDGSLRRVRLVLAPRLDAGESVAIGLAPCARGEAAPPPAPDAAALDTASVRARFLPHRGGALASLAFPALGASPLVGTLPHGSFDAIAFTPDFYSGHVVLEAGAGGKCTTLAAAERTDVASDGVLRGECAFSVRTPVGLWRTRYRAYRYRARLDVVHELELRDVDVRSLRLGIATLLPAAFDRRTLRLRAVNGGDVVEEHAIARGARIEQGRAVSSTVSATSCLGATEGWVSLGDAVRGVAVVGDRAAVAVAPMLDVCDVDESFFARISHSAAETDDTTCPGQGYRRGAFRFPFALLGHAGGVDVVRRTARAIDRGLVVRHRGGVEILGGL
ncbi:MAG: hypothetical protein R3E88_18095 [Myxococcota bacterium]